MNTKSVLCLALLLSLPTFSTVEAAALDAIDWYPEPSGVRVVNQTKLEGVIRNAGNMEATQIFTLNSSGAISAIGIALGGAAGTPSLTTSLYRVSNGVVQALPLATSIRPAEYFADIGPQTVPVWVYAEFSSLVPVSAGEQIAFRIQSPRAELWGPRSDALPGGDLIEIPGTDLAFRVYIASLSFVTVGTNLVLGWPSSVTNGAVEATVPLPSPMSWTSVHTITAATNHYWAVIEPGARFFRLKIQ